MNELGSRARSLIDAMQEADEPSARDQARVRAKIDARLGLAGAAATVVASVSSKAGAAGAGIGSAAGSVASSGISSAAVLAAGKVLLAVAVTGGAVSAGIVALRAAEPRRGEAPVPVASVSKKQLAPPAPPRAEQSRPERTDESVARDVPAPASSAPAKIKNERRAQSRAELSAARANAPAERALPRLDSVKEEAALLASARAAIASGDTRLALEQLDEHALRFPRGELREERRAARVLALCASGKSAEARAAAAAFIAESPRSPLVGSVRRACTGTGR